MQVENDLVTAATIGDATRVSWLLDECRVPVDDAARDGLRETALLRAVRAGHTEVASLLVGHRANVNAIDARGRTALSLAAQAGNLAMVELCVAANADIGVADADGRTALHWAAMGGHVPIVHYLLAEGANYDQVDNAGEAPVCYACVAESPSVCDVVAARREERLAIERAKREKDEEEKRSRMAALLEPPVSDAKAKAKAKGGRGGARGGGRAASAGMVRQASKRT